MFRYIDLFCGIGGFHQGMNRVSAEMGFDAECVFAADNDQNAANVYRMNYGIDCYHDLKLQETHDLIDDAIGEEGLTCLFGGFPCQPFSKAGSQEGFANKMKGTLFFEIEKIVHRHHPKFILLENVRNLKNHDSGHTWEVIHDSLVEEGYVVDDVIISPNHIGPIPALRERFFILAYNTEFLGIEDDDIDMLRDREFRQRKTSIYPCGQIERGLNRKYFNLDAEPDLEPFNEETIQMWDDLLQLLRENGRTIISPLWPHYFDSTIDISEEPDWKQKIIRKNQEFYKDNSDIYDRWLDEHKDHFNQLCQSDKKFEWNAGEDLENVWQGIIQFRPSGVRVKRPDFIPTLVAINQTPILGPKRRYLKASEMAKIYGFKRLKFGKQSEGESQKQLGNTVSVDVVSYLIRHMIETSGWEDGYE